MLLFHACQVNVADILVASHAREDDPSDSNSLKFKEWAASLRPCKTAVHSLSLPAQARQPLLHLQLLLEVPRSDAFAAMFSGR